MRNDPLKTLLALLALGLAGQAQAESTADALTRIEGETLLLKAREKQLEVQANILGKQNEIAMRQAVKNTVAPPVPEGGKPVVRGIEGLGEALYASVQMHDGSVYDVQAGSTLPNGMKVVSVRFNEVMVRDGGGKLSRLAAYAHTPAAGGFAQAAASTAPVAPLPPGLPAPGRGAPR